MTRRLTAFAELAALIDDLPLLLRTLRRARRASLRDVAEESGVSFNTLSRVERGGPCSSQNLRALLLWFDGDHR